MSSFPFAFHVFENDLNVVAIEPVVYEGSSGHTIQYSVYCNGKPVPFVVRCALAQPTRWYAHDFSNSLMGMGKTPEDALRHLTL